MCVVMCGQYRNGVGSQGDKSFPGRFGCQNRGTGESVELDDALGGGREVGCGPRLD